MKAERQISEHRQMTAVRDILRSAAAEDERIAEIRRRAIERQWGRISPGVVYIDPRVGSREFHPYFKTLAVKAGVYDETLIAGDFAFKCGHTKANPWCNGDHGCRIGVERKTLGDLIGSLLKNRLGKQIPDLLDSYDLSWLVIEGPWRPGEGDAIEIPMVRSEDWLGKWRPGRVSLTYSQLSSWLVRYDVLGMGRIKRWRTINAGETVAFIASVFRWWQKEWDRHQVEALNKMPAPDHALMFRATRMEICAFALPDVGIKSMKKLCAYFPSIYDLYTASEKQLQRAGLGKKDAATVWNAIRRRYW